MMEWQPIESALKDGTMVLVAFGDDAHAPVVPAQWRTNNYYEEGWYGWAGYDLHELREPTHWMPLPEPPHNKAEER